MTELEAFRKGKVTFIAVASGMRVVSFLRERCIFWLEVVVILKEDGDDGLVIDCEGDVANSYEGSTTPWHASLHVGPQNRDSEPNSSLY